MIKTIRKASNGFEDVYELLLQKKSSLETRKEDAKQVALQKVDADFEEEANRIENSILNVTEEVEIEVPDVVEEQVEFVETVDGQVEENIQ